MALNRSMNINMVTIMRTPEYLHDTLASLFKSDWTGVVNLIVGSEDDRYVQRYLHDGRINIIPWEFEKASSGFTPELLEALRFRQKFTRMDRRWNLGCAKIVAWNCGYGIFCEDDVKFEGNWFSQLQQIISELPSEQEYVLNLAKGRSLMTDSRLVGSQCVYFSSHELQVRCARSFVEKYSTPGAAVECTDVLIGRFAVKNARLYCKKLVSHVGHVSCFSKKREKIDR